MESVDTVICYWPELANLLIGIAETYNSIYNKMLVHTKQYADEGSVKLWFHLQENQQKLIESTEKIEDLSFKIKGRDSTIKALRCKISEMEAVEENLKH